MSSSEASAPRSANASLATAISRSRLRRASARSRGGAISHSGVVTVVLIVTISKGLDKRRQSPYDKRRTAPFGSRRRRHDTSARLMTSYTRRRACSVAERVVPFGDVDTESRRAATAAKRAARRAAHPSIALAVIVTCPLMLILDATIVNIALPNIQRSLHFAATSLSWVVSAYSLAFGGLLLLGGRSGDILGRRRNFMVGLGVFTVASLLGGFATSAGWLLAT